MQRRLQVLGAIVQIVLIRHPAAVERGIAECLTYVSGIEQFETLAPPLHAVAALRALEPDLIVMETDGCEADSVSLLS
jgi:chemotaxis response regulator CheB